MSSFLERHEERMRALVAPLREEEREVSERVASLEAELAQLRPLRNEIRRQIRALTGEPATNLNGKPHGNSQAGKRKGRSHTKVGEERLRAVMEWIEEHAHEYPDGMSGSVVSRVPGFPIPGQSQTSAAFRTLHARGLLVLDHIGGTGQAKWYRLAERGG